MSLFIDSSYFSIRIGTKTNLDTADTLQILYKKPDGSTGFWEATQSARELVYEVQDGDIDQDGEWQFQGYIVVNGREGFTDIHKYKFCEHIIIETGS